MSPKNMTNLFPRVILHKFGLKIWNHLSPVVFALFFGRLCVNLDVNYSFGFSPYCWDILRKFGCKCWINYTPTWSKHAPADPGWLHVGARGRPPLPPIKLPRMKQNSRIASGRKHKNLPNVGFATKMIHMQPPPRPLRWPNFNSYLLFKKNTC